VIVAPSVVAVDVTSAGASGAGARTVQPFASTFSDSIPVTESDRYTKFSIKFF